MNCITGRFSFGSGLNRADFKRSQHLDSAGSAEVGGRSYVASVDALTGSAGAGAFGAAAILAADRPGQRARRSCPAHAGHRHEGLLRRPALTLAAADQRENQRTAAPVLPKRNRPVPMVSRRPRSHRPSPGHIDSVTLCRRERINVHKSDEPERGYREIALDPVHGSREVSGREISRLASATNA
jgi:hypothetical protein